MSNPTKKAVSIAVSSLHETQKEKGANGKYTVETTVNELRTPLLPDNKPAAFTIVFAAYKSSEQPAAVNYKTEEDKRKMLIQHISGNLILPLTRF
ncbi:MAG: hypothetical protein ACR2KZ_13635 [Segetibacter sp.]